MQIAQVDAHELWELQESCPASSAPLHSNQEAAQLPKGEARGETLLAQT